MVKIPQVYKEEAMSFATAEAKKRKGSVGDAKWKQDFHDYLADALPSITMGRNPATKTLKEQGQSVFQGVVAQRVQKFGGDKVKAIKRFKQLFGDIVEWYFEHTVDNKYKDSNFTDKEKFHQIVVNRYMRYYMAALLRAFIKKLYSMSPDELAKNVASVEGFSGIKTPPQAGMGIKGFIDDVEKTFMSELERINLLPEFTRQLSLDERVSSNPKKKKKR